MSDTNPNKKAPPSKRQQPQLYSPGSPLRFAARDDQRIIAENREVEVLDHYFQQWQLDACEKRVEQHINDMDQFKQDRCEEGVEALENVNNAMDSRINMSNINVNISPIKRRSSSPSNPSPPKDPRIRPSTKHLQLTPPIFETPSGDPEPKQKGALKLDKVFVFEEPDAARDVNDGGPTYGSVTKTWLVGCCVLAFVVGVAAGLVAEAYKRRERTG
ncbi:Fc.00g095900.m01.CDS01 [Cosmosporella sp. VM-42]